LELSAGASDGLAFLAARWHCSLIEENKESTLLWSNWATFVLGPGSFFSSIPIASARPTRLSHEEYRVHFE